jgi:hypothetical protein
MQYATSLLPPKTPLEYRLLRAIEHLSQDRLSIPSETYWVIAQSKIKAIWLFLCSMSHVPCPMPYAPFSRIDYHQGDSRLELRNVKGCEGF